MTVSERIGNGKLVHLPVEAGDIDKPRFDPNAEWLPSAPPEEQKTAMWRWFATRFESPVTAVPHDALHDDGGNPEAEVPSEFLFLDGEPFHADRVLHDRFDGTVPPAVVDELVAIVTAEAGNQWVPKTIDRFGG